MTAPQSGTDPTSELVERLRAASSVSALDAGARVLLAEAADALAAAGTAPTPPTVSAEMIERIRERAIGSALEGPDPLMVELHAALTATTPPTVDVTQEVIGLREWLDDYEANVLPLHGNDRGRAEFARDLGAVLAAVQAMTPPTVDVTALDEWKALVEAADRWDEETDRDRQRGAMGDTAVRAVKLLRAAVRAQGVPSTNPSGGAE